MPREKTDPASAPAKTRRRGKALEADILQAAWSELSSKGFAAFTIDAVASAARASRTGIYKRWEDRGALALAAIQYRVNAENISVPDLGNITDELIEMTRQYVERGMPVLVLAMVEMSSWLREAGWTLSDFRTKILREDETPLSEIFLRAAARGEIDPARLTPERASLFFELVRHELLMTQQMPSDHFLRSRIEGILLPLLRRDNKRA